MRYIIDSNSLSQIFKSIYSETFHSFWTSFNSFVEEGYLLTTREVMNEIERFNEVSEELITWLNNRSINNNDFFSIPNVEELDIVTQIFKNKQFNHSISKQNYLRGYPCADPFIIAKAKIIEGTVITEEKYKENSARIPNICKFFSIDCINLREFFQEQKWQF